MIPTTGSGAGRGRAPVGPLPAHRQFSSVKRSKEGNVNKQEARDYLREVVPPGATVYTVLRHVTKSGLNRDISLYGIHHRTGEPFWITGVAATVLGEKLHRAHNAIRVHGAGMDMGFDLVYRLSRTLYPDFECIGEGCPSNDHSNGDHDRTPHPHTDGGYALRQRWLW